VLNMTGVRHVQANSRYELETPHGLAIVVYRQQGDRLLFTHTEVPSTDEGHGFGSQLVRWALDDAQRRGF
jgi:predicted GNAT family acetyltransferase